MSMNPDTTPETRIDPSMSPKIQTSMLLGRVAAATPSSSVTARKSSPARRMRYR